MRFPDRERHQIFLEPEGQDVDEIYVNGYSMSLPVTTAVVGMPRVEMLEHNIEVARSFSPLSEHELQQLRQELTPARDGMEKRLVGHLDGPTQSPEVFSA